MAITKTLENDKIEVVNKAHVQVRTATIIKEDGKEEFRLIVICFILPLSLVVITFKTVKYWAFTK